MFVTNEDNWFVFAGPVNHGSSEADTKLIAAAPELLEALRSTIPELRELHQFYINEADSFNVGSDERRMNIRNAHDVERKIKSIEAAILKATT